MSSRGRTATIRPTFKQHESYQALQDKVVRFVFFGGGAGGGKSWHGCEWLLTSCFFYPGSRWFIGRNELTRLMKSTYITWTKVCAYHQIPLSDWTLNGQHNYIEFKNGSRIDLLDIAYKPSDPEYQRLGSLEYTGGFIDEAGEVDFMAFDVLKSRVGRHMNRELQFTPKILLTCNPIKNWIYREVYKKWKEGVLPPEYKFIQSLYNDNPHTAEDYGEALAQIKNTATRQRLMYGNWEYDDDSAVLIPYEYIADIWNNIVEVNKNQKYITGDIARYGQDKTVFMVWYGFVCKKIVSYEKRGLDQTAEALDLLAREENIPYRNIIVDEDGVGGGVVDNLRGIKGFINNARPLLYNGNQENYSNLKTQCYYHLAEKIVNHEIKIECEDYTIREALSEELEQVKQKDQDKDGKLKIIPKEEVKELLGRSPDYADALMMRMYFIFNETKKVSTRVSSSKIHYAPKW